MTPWQRAMAISRIFHLARYRRPEREPILVQKCARLWQHRALKHACDICTGTGPPLAMVVAWRTPIQEGGKRTWQNVLMSCRGCWSETQRKDGLDVPEGATIHDRALDARSPIKIIELR